MVFFNFRNTISPQRVGGLDTVARAIADLAVAEGLVVEHVSYGWSASERGDNCFGLRFSDLVEALQYIAHKADVVISFYIDPASRLRFARFRRRHRKRIRFAVYLSVWNPSALRRNLSMVELWLRYDGGVYCASERLTSLARRFDRRASLLYPLTRSVSPSAHQERSLQPLRLNFSGRFDPRKGLYEAIDIMRHARQLIPCDCTVSGYFWPDDRVEKEVRDRLADNPWIKVHETGVEAWSEEVEKRLERQLAETDIMLLPYRSLSSTVDTPLLLLEAMALKCVVYLPSSARRPLRGLVLNPGLPSPADDAPEKVAEWIADLASDRDLLARVQSANAAWHETLQRQARETVRRMLAID